jgi:hypothetical protein
MKFNVFDTEPAKQLPHLGDIVQRQDELSPNRSKLLGQFLEVRFLEVMSVEFSSPIRRVEIEERGVTVEPLDDFPAWQALDLNPFQSLMSVFNELRELFEVESRRLDHVPVVGWVSHEARKAILEKIEIPRRPLNIGECCRVDHFLEIKHPAAHEDEAEIPDQLLVMQLAHAEEVYDLAVQVIQHFDGRRLFMKEHLCAAREGLDVGRMLREYLNDPLCETVFPSYI